METVQLGAPIFLNPTLEQIQGIQSGKISGQLPNEPLETTTRRAREMNVGNRNVGAKALDIVSGLVLEPTTFIHSPSEAGLMVAERRKATREGDFNPWRTVGEATAFAATGSALVLGLAPAAATGAAGAAVRSQVGSIVKPAFSTIPRALFSSNVIALTASSQLGRGFVAHTIDNPFLPGIKAGEIIDKASQGIPTTFKDALSGVGAEGLLFAGGAAAATTAYFAGKKLLSSAAPALPTTINAPAVSVPSPTLPSSIEAPSVSLPTTTTNPLTSTSTTTISPGTPVVNTGEPATSQAVAAPQASKPVRVTVNNNIKLTNRLSAFNKKYIKRRR